LRGKDKKDLSEFDEYSLAMIVICSRTVTQSNGMASFYLYESAKDNLKWYNLRVKDYIHDVMQIGTLVNLSEESFNKLSSDEMFSGLTKEDIEEMYKD